MDISAVASGFSIFCSGLTSMMAKVLSLTTSIFLPSADSANPSASARIVFSSRSFRS
jgi:hypothetical protein